MSYKIGDVVFLKSDLKCATPMTIIDIDSDEQADEFKAVCQWICKMGKREQMTIKSKDVIKPLHEHHE